MRSYPISLIKASLFVLGLFCGTAALAQVTPMLRPYLSKPGDQATLVSPVVTEDFESFAIGQMPPNATGSSALGTYVAVGEPHIMAADLWGGAGGIGKYLFVEPDANRLELQLAQPAKYVGLWWSAGNGGNVVEVFDALGVLLATFNTADLTSFLGSAGPATSVGGTTYNKADYLGNSNSTPRTNPSEPYAYVNLEVTDSTRSIARLVFRGSRFEVDNISVRSQVMPPDPSWVPLTPRVLADAVNDQFSTPLNTPITSTVASNDPGVPANSVFTALTQPTHGNLVFNADGTFTYTPAAGYAGQDSFTYQVCLPAPQQTLCAQASVTITVGANVATAVPTLSAWSMALLGAGLAGAAAHRRRRRRSNSRH